MVGGLGNIAKTVQGATSMRYVKLNNGFSVQLSGRDLFNALQPDGFVPTALAAQADKLFVEVAVTWET
jgi:hypothetical protein